MEFLFWLFVAHFIGDFALQSQFMAEHKSKLWLVMFAHVTIWTGVLMIPVKLYGHEIAIAAPTMFVTHYIIDYCKMRMFDTLEDKKGKVAKHLFYFDQYLHGAQIVMMWATL